MCVDCTDLNRAFPKDAYPLPNIDKLVDNSSCYKLLSCMDTYYNIPLVSYWHITSRTYQRTNVREFHVWREYF